MKNKFTLSILLAAAILLTACGAQATPAPVSVPTEAPYTRGDGSSAVVATDTAPAADGYESYGSQSDAQATTASEPAAGGEAISVGAGSFLVAANGMTLYLLATDPSGTSTCSGGCANNWPPLTVTGGAAAGAGVDSSLLATTTRADGSTQVTYNGHPLYYFRGDSAPGDQNGQGSGGVWFVVSAAGEAVK